MNATVPGSQVPSPVHYPASSGDERLACVSFLRTMASEHRKHAVALLADTTQNAPDADKSRAAAVALEQAAEFIGTGRHWR
jgi:hypothetical protein